MSNSSKLLTIAIPTRNRHEYLDENLESLNKQINNYGKIVEIIICDNSTNDYSKRVVEKYNTLNLNIKYIKNKHDIGSDKNIAKCFNLANGKYIHIIGDDDIYFDNTLDKIIQILKEGDYGSVFLRPYGFNTNYLSEYPPFKIGSNKIYNKDDFLLKIATQITLLSAHVINKSLINEKDANKYCGSNLVQVNLLFDAVTRAKENYYFNKYLIAYRKNNSGGYDFFDIFINKFSEILGKYVDEGLISNNLMKKIECKKIKCFFPIYLFRLKYYCSNCDHKKIELAFKRLKNYKCYKLYIEPIFKLPTILSFPWCLAIVIYGRIINGDIALGVVYFKKLVFKNIFQTKI